MHKQIESAPSVPSKGVFFCQFLFFIGFFFFRFDDKKYFWSVHLNKNCTKTVQTPTTTNWSTVMLKDYTWLLYLTAVLKEYYIDLHIHAQV